MDNTLKTVLSRKFFYTDNNYEKHTLANNLKEISFDILKDMGFDIKTLEKNGYIEIIPNVIRRNPFINKDGKPLMPTNRHGKVKHLLKTNLQFIEPTEYLITYPITLTILEYKVNEISSKPFYIKEHNQKYNLYKQVT